MNTIEGMVIIVALICVTVIICNWIDREKPNVWENKKARNEK
jgi:hypothetical protein